MLTIVLALVVLAQPPPDTLIVHATIPSLSDADAIAVHGGRVVAVGKSESLLGHTAAYTRVVDAQGRVVLPGLIDSHIHFVSGGIAKQNVDLSGARSIEELTARVKAFAVAHPNRQWIGGRGWMYDLFKGLTPAYPTRQMLDAVVKDRPVFLRSYDGHTGWANTAALVAAGLSKASVDPKDGKIIREADGTPAGALLEGAMDALWAKQPPPTAQERAEGALTAQALALGHGLTAVNDFAAGPEALETYLALEAKGELKIRIFFSPPLETPLADVNAMVKRLTESGSKKVRFGSLKAFVDGVIESNTAAFLAPYADDHAVHGEPHLKPADLEKLIVPADRAGYSVSLHAIGDRSVRLALDAFELAAKKNQTKDRRHRIEHIEVMDPADAPRFGKLGVVASMQPYHAEPADQPGSGVWEIKIGAARLPHIFPWRELKNAGATLAFGSDWSVMSLDPLMGLAVATSRQNGHGRPVDGWVGSQKLGFAEALTAYTRDAAWALHAERELGMIAVGQRADLVMLARKVDPAEPLSLYWGGVDLTMIDGEVVYDAEKKVKTATARAAIGLQGK